MKQECFYFWDTTSGIQNLLPVLDRSVAIHCFWKAIFFTLVGLPRSLQSDQGSNFMSGLMQTVMYQLSIKQYKSAAYHPEYQGALERFHQTLNVHIV